MQQALELGGEREEREEGLVGQPVFTISVRFWLYGGAGASAGAGAVWRAWRFVCQEQPTEDRRAPDGHRPCSQQKKTKRLPQIEAVRRNPQVTGVRLVQPVSDMGLTD